MLCLTYPQACQRIHGVSQTACCRHPHALSCSQRWHSSHRMTGPLPVDVKQRCCTHTHCTDATSHSPQVNVSKKAVFSSVVSANPLSLSKRSFIPKNGLPSSFVCVHICACMCACVCMHMTLCNYSVFVCECGVYDCLIAIYVCLCICLTVDLCVHLSICFTVCASMLLYTDTLYRTPPVTVRKSMLARKLCSVQSSVQKPSETEQRKLYSKKWFAFLFSFHLCMYVCTFVCVCTFIYVCVCICVYEGMRMYVSERERMHMTVITLCICMSVLSMTALLLSVCVCLCICLFTCVYIYPSA